MKAVFDTKPTSVYDDDISQRYQFPKRYLSIAQKSLDDWVVFRRPRADGGNLAYFATAHVSSIEPDFSTPGMYYAHLRDYLNFENPVPWNNNENYAEQALRDITRAEVGVFMRGRSIRPLEDADFDSMIAHALPSYWEKLSDDRFNRKQGHNRRVEQVLVNRTVREADFRKRICSTYDNTCAVTGLNIVDKKGNFEVQAAHIWPVADGGPDTTHNGIALSSTAHWLFDRHLISVSSEYRLLIHEEFLPSHIKNLLKPAGNPIGLPRIENERPNIEYLARHQAKFEAVNRP